MTGFLNPALLWGLLLVSAPIIIHLLNKRRFDVHHWAAMDFLLDADVQNRRRLRIEDLLLLLLRALVIAAAVFLVARPVVEGFGGKEESERTIVIDDSFSMEHRPAGISSLERARETAVFEVQEAIASGTRVSVRRGTKPMEEVGAVAGKVSDEGRQSAVDSRQQEFGSSGSGSSNPQSPIRNPQSEDPSISASRLLSALRTLPAADGALKFAEVLNAEAERIEQSHSAEIHAVHLITDFRRSDWLESGGRLRPRIEEALARLAKAGKDRIRLRLTNVAGSGRENTAVTRVAVDAAQPVAGVPVSVLVEVRNFGLEERRGLSGEIEIGDPASPSHRIPLPMFPAVPPGGTSSVEVQFVFPAPGEYPLSARIDEDRLPRDDRAFAVVVVRSALSVLVTDGDPGADRFGGEAGFLAAALAPRGGLPTGLAPEVVSRNPSAADLKGRDVALLLNCAEFSEAERDALDRFVRAGGGAAFFLGNKVRPDRYKEVLGDGGLFPAVLAEQVESPVGGTRIDFGNMAHPTLAAYRGMRDASVERITVARYFGLQAAPGAEAAATYADGPRTPAILERPLGAGRTALFNLSADRDWTDWPTDPSYPVLLQEWIRHLAPRRGEARAIRVGEALAFPEKEGEGTVAPSTSPSVASSPAPSAGPSAGEPGSHEGPGVIDPRGNRWPATLDGGTVRFDRTEIAGMYRAAQASESAEGQRWFAVNRAVEESDLAPATEGELRGVLTASGISISFADSSKGEASEQREGDIWRWLALSAAFLLLSELALAYWFGRR
jgi:aerotolerance regulator-like protein